MAETYNFIEYTEETAAAIRKARDLPTRGDGQSPWPEHQRQQLLPPLMSNVSSAAEEKTQFKCEYSNIDGDGNEGNFIHVYDETGQTTPSRAGIAWISDGGRIWIPETWVSIPNLENGTTYNVYLVHTYNSASSWEFKISRPYRYWVYVYFEHYILAEIVRNDNDYNVTQILKSENGEDFNIWPSGNLLRFGLKNYELTIDDSYDVQRLVLGTKNKNDIEPVIVPDTFSYPSQLKHSDPVIPSGYEMEMVNNGKVPHVNILFSADDTYHMTSQFFDGEIGVFQIEQANFYGRPLATGIRTIDTPSYIISRALNLPSLNWSSYPFYQYFNVDFVLTRQIQRNGTYIFVTYTATGIRIFNPFNPNGPAGYVQYTSWTVPSGTLSLPNENSYLYLTATWTEGASVPTFNYTYDISNIDQTKTWVKELAYIPKYGYNGKYEIRQSTDRNFEIYGRWV